MPSFLELSENEVTNKHLVKELIVKSATIDNSDPQCIINFGRQLKDACHSFSCASKTLVKYHLRHGSISEANDLRKIRYQIIHSDAQESIDFMNAWLSNLNNDGISDLESVSSSLQEFSPQIIKQQVEQDFSRISLDESNVPQTIGHAEVLASAHASQNTGASSPSSDIVTNTSSIPIMSTFPVVERFSSAANIDASSNIPLNMTPRNNLLNLPSVQDYPNLANPPNNPILSSNPIPPSNPIPSFNPICREFVPSYSSGISPRPLSRIHLEENPHVHVSLPLSPLTQHYVHQNPLMSSYHPQVPPANFTRPFTSNYPTSAPPSHHFEMPASHQQNQNYQDHRLEPSVRHRLKCDLLNGLGDPFKGNAEFYFQWQAQLQKRITECEADALDSIQIIVANTEGHVKETVKNFLSAGILDSTSTLQEIWHTLQARFGSSDKVADSILQKLKSLDLVKNVSDLVRFEKLVDVCRIALSSIRNNKELEILHMRQGMDIILDKLPDNFCKQWRTRHYKHQEATGSAPDFHLFVKFLSDKLKEYSLPCAQGSRKILSKPVAGRGLLKTFRTDITDSTNYDQQTCIYHNIPGHSITECRVFESLPYQERKYFANNKQLCYFCLEQHKPYECNKKDSIKCKICDQPHITVMHRNIFNRNPLGRWSAGYSPQGHNNAGRGNNQRGDYSPGHGAGRYGNGRGAGRFGDGRGPGRYGDGRGSRQDVPRGTHFRQGVEQRGPSAPGQYNNPNPDNLSKQNNKFFQEKNVRNTCTTICGDVQKSNICSKTVLVDIRHKDRPGILRGLCIIDEQSNASFCDEKVIQFFKPDICQEDYSLSTMNGSMKVKGHSVSGLQVKGAQQGKYYQLPAVFTHPELPDTKHEAATAGIVRAHPHISRYAVNFPNNLSNFDVLLLVGANCGEIMSSRTYGSMSPYVHETPLGYAVVGPVCTNEGSSRHQQVRALRTAISTSEGEYESTTLARNFVPRYSHEKFQSPFEVKDDDDLPGKSQEDRLWEDIITNSIGVNRKGSVEMNLPLKPGAEIPNNKNAVFYRTKNTLMRLKRDKDKLASCIKVLGEYIEAGHVEQLPASCQTPYKVNHIPIFAVFNENTNKTRLVFDSSASIKGKSLNNALLQGPDEGNKLIGVLMRFRKGEIAFSADVEKMFHAFYVREEDRDLLRFFWFEGNNPENEIVEYRANVMIFGNNSSPACATYGLRYTTLDEKSQSLPESCKFINHNMYVDDGLGSADTVSEALDILQGSISILARYNIRLHKIVSSSQDVLDAFPESELAEVKISPDKSDNRTLGVLWCPHTDTMSLDAEVPIRPFTKRGILAVIHSVYDPMGICSPVLLQAKLIQREIIPTKDKCTPELEMYDWDDPLPEKHVGKWSEWLRSLQDIQDIKIPRCHKPRGFGKVLRYELHCFSDASKDAIGHVIYLRCVNENQDVSVAFIQGTSKVSPRTADTIPRLELCAAMDTVHSALKVIEEIDVEIGGTYFYTDSLIVMGYLQNTKKRFSRYVTRRVEEILKFSKVPQWSHISGSHNVGDIATKPHNPKELLQTDWFIGPQFLRIEGMPIPSVKPTAIDLPEEQKVKILKTECAAVQAPSFIKQVCTHTKSWKKAVSIVRHWIRYSRILRKKEKLGELEETKQAEALFILDAQLEFSEQVDALKKKGKLKSNESLSSLSPFVDNNGTMRVGGRLKNSDFPPDVRHPILLPSQHPVTEMIVAHQHQKVSHQGRVLTHGAVRQVGYHILHASKVIKRFISDCVFCRRLRGRPQEQIMADLPSDRIETLAPFRNVGIDMFGPYFVHDGKTTRRSSATKKVWALIVTCLASRAIHVEMVPSMDTSSFELALRRFFAIRGTCVKIRSDQGSNFIGAINQMVDIEQLQRVASSHNISWELNPPHASNYGGVWERKIGAIKAVLNSTLKLTGKRNLSRDELGTLLQEATCVVNNTPLWSVSSSPDDPCPLSPANLITLKDVPNPPSLDEFSKDDMLEYGRRRWRRIAYLSEQFWLRWKQNYLQNLQERKRWKAPNHNINLGDIVLLRGKTKRNEWPMGRIIEANPSTDGLVRRVKVRIGSKGTSRTQVFERSVRDTVLLIPSDQTGAR